MSEFSRRNLFRAAGALGAATALPPALEARPRQRAHEHGHPGPQASAAPGKQPYRFFNPQEAAFVEAAVDRLIPPDPQWTGAVGAGVPTYIDQQLAGAYGQGARLYKSGPWEQGAPTQGYQLALTPAQLYRTAIAALEEQLRSRSPAPAAARGAERDRSRASRRGGLSSFARLSPEEQDRVLADLEAGKMDLAGAPSAEFFETLLANTIEGFLSDPMYGGNRDMVGWRMIGFPGAYATYLGVYTDHGQRFQREPMSIAQSDQEHHPEPGGALPAPRQGGRPRG
ncbi:gluconate 2-dehydrogenase subunit 3 family protein [Alsobacter sp. KACC 23698]|uniref:Gluconate 2-dehydrogenase subunit 3 family protein n=1 Tax=Alsobacter sp. KACC 23698 TaxID=3149229 RepID=A0AAU7JC08_9HYPH